MQQSLSTGEVFPGLETGKCGTFFEKASQFKVRKRAKIRNRYNQAPHLTQDTNGKVTNSQVDTKNESQEVSPFQAGPQGKYKNIFSRHRYLDNIKKIDFDKKIIKI